MNYKKIFYFVVVFLLLTGCAAKQEPVSMRPPKKLITQDEYVDLKIKPNVEEPFVVDYKKGGVYKPSINTKL